MGENIDAHLVSRLQEGDRKAFDVIVAQYEKPIFNVAYRMLGDPDAAADVTQTAFLKAFEKIETFDPRYKFFSWLYRIAVNEALNRIARRKRRQSVDVDQPATQRTPADDYDREEASEQLERALRAMKVDHRIVIVLKHLLFLSYREIAEILDIEEKTVKSRLFTARQVLKAELEKQGYQG
jgi:RNA polymerase sigma-70 factor (ECF subfamily)